MKENDKTKEIIEQLKSLRGDIWQIVDFFRANIPYDLLTDKDFMNRLKTEVPKVKDAMQIMELEDITSEIEMEIEKIGLQEVIEKIIKNGEDLKKIDKSHKHEMYDIAKEYENNGDYSKAKHVYLAITSYRKDEINKFVDRYGEEKQKRETLYYKAKYSYFICKIKNGEELTEEDLKELEKLLKDDKENVLKLKNPGKLSSIDIFLSYCEELPIEELEREILALKSEDIGGHSNGDENDGGDVPPKPTKDYDESLSPDKRLKYLMDHYKIKKVSRGKDIFEGYYVFEMEDSDALIIENFWKRIKGGIIAPTNNAAVFILDKDVELDLEQLTLAQLRARGKEIKKQEGYTLIKGVNHTRTGGRYYERLNETYDFIVSEGQRYRRDRQITKGKSIEKQSDSKGSKERSLEDISTETTQEEQGDQNTTDTKEESLDIKVLKEMIEMYEEERETLATHLQDKMIELGRITERFETAKASWQISNLTEVINSQMEALVALQEEYKKLIGEVEKIKDDSKKIEEELITMKKQFDDLQKE